MATAWAPTPRQDGAGPLGGDEGRVAGHSGEVTGGSLVDRSAALRQGGVGHRDADQVVVGALAPLFGQAGVFGGREAAGGDGGVEVGHGLLGSGVAFRGVPVLPGGLLDAVGPFPPVIGDGEDSASLDSESPPLGIGVGPALLQVAQVGGDGGLGRGPMVRVGDGALVGLEAPAHCGVGGVGGSGGQRGVGLGDALVGGRSVE